MSRRRLVAMLVLLTALGRAPVPAACAPFTGPDFSGALDWRLEVGRPAAGRDLPADLRATREMLRRQFARLCSEGDSSEIAGVNRLAGNRSGRLTRANYDLVLRGLAWKDKSQGTVDMLAGPLRRVWGLRWPSRAGSKEESLGCMLADDGRDTLGWFLESQGAWPPQRLERAWPTQAERDSALALTRDGGTYFVDLGVLLRRPGMEIDLDPLLDGVLVDRGLDSLRARGHAGQRLRVGGVRRDDGQGPAWELPLLHPLDGRELGRLALSGRALATLDLAQWAVMLDDKPVPALVDPRDGALAQRVAAVWVLAPTGEQARAWSIALALLGGEEGLALLAAQPGVEGALLLSGEGGPTWQASPGFPLADPIAQQGR